MRLLLASGGDIPVVSVSLLRVIKVLYKDSLLGHKVIRLYLQN